MKLRWSGWLLEIRVFSGEGCFQSNSRRKVLNIEGRERERDRETAGVLVLVEKRFTLTMLKGYSPVGQRWATLVQGGVLQSRFGLLYYWNGCFWQRLSVHTLTAFFMLIQLDERASFTVCYNYANNS